jgi:hypothetical protein
MKELEAIIEANGAIRLLEPVRLAHSCRAVVTIVEGPEIPETALLSQQTLAKDWERPEEEKAWESFQ